MRLDLDVGSGAQAVFAEIGEHYGGPVVATQDLTVFNVTADAVVARQADVDDAPHPVHGPSRSHAVETMAAPPSWWTDAALEL